MATDTVTTLSLVTLAQEFRGDVVRQINRTCATLRMLRIVPGSGKNIAWAPEAAGAFTENYAEGADAEDFAADAQTQAILTWSLYRANIHATTLAMDAAGSSSTPEGNRELWARHVTNHSAALASKINGEVFAGSGSGTAMAGLAVAVAAGNTYATLDRTSSSPDYSFWQSTVVDPGTDTSITMKLIRDDLRKVFEACGEQPDMAPCSPAVFAEVGALFDNTRRVIDSVRSATGEIKLDFGFQAVECDGCVFYRDKDCTAKAIYYLNSSYVEVQYLPSASQQMLIEAAGGEVSADDGFGSVPLGFKYEMLAKTGASDKAQILWTGNLVVERPNSCGKRLHVAVTS